jgi:hypothetical protein
LTGLAPPSGLYTAEMALAQKRPTLEQTPLLS